MLYRLQTAFRYAKTAQKTLLIIKRNLQYKIRLSHYCLKGVFTL